MNSATDLSLLSERAYPIKLILMDCDGVLTDGRIILLPDGSEIKFFHVQDGQGIALARQAGLLTGIISGRESTVLLRRAAEMHIDIVKQRVADKKAAYQEILTNLSLRDEQVAFIGDDLPDLAPMRQVGLAIAVANAVAEVKQIAHFITLRTGGQGAVREAVEMILQAKLQWQEIINKY